MPLATEREMTWTGVGAHADTAVPEFGPTWYFAEGSTTGGFRTFYLLQNPGLAPVTVDMTFLTPSSITRQFVVPAQNRVTVDAGAIPELANADLAAIVQVVGPGTIAAARSIYRDVGDHPFRAGTSGSAVGASTEWFFAEGVANSFFSHYLILFNPHASAAADVHLGFLTPDKGVVQHTVVVPPMSRRQILVDALDPALEGEPTALHVAVTNGVPVAAERSMWWSRDSSFGGVWYEGHTAVGTPMLAPRWAFPRRTLEPESSMYLLIGNPGSASATARITLTHEDDSAPVHAVDVAPQSRATIELGAAVPAAIGRTFHLDVESLGPTPVPLVVERAIIGRRTAPRGHPER